MNENRNSKSGRRPVDLIIRQFLNFLRDGAVGGACSSDKLAEQALRKRVAEHTLGMPLNANYPIRVTGPLDPFDCSVAGTGGHSEVVTGLVNRLVMAAVDLCLGRLAQPREPTARREACLV